MLFGLGGIVKGRRLRTLAPACEELTGGGAADASALGRRQMPVVSARRLNAQRQAAWQCIQNLPEREMAYVPCLRMADYMRVCCGIGSWRAVSESGRLRQRSGRPPGSDRVPTY